MAKAGQTLLERSACFDHWEMPSKRALVIDEPKEPPQPPPSREEKLPPPEDSPDAIKLPGTPQLPIIPDEPEPDEEN